ncbi:pisatin demethylase [Penicillium lagena]|uniref:pisatin demethylase n=1 Tax=Penicillium lagena TaxID=94218 RepID=UPI0025424479|nr:pisatin demethylase [Penicillium lagena]KAJ5601138.1 pisatin demethylase [Penicillium lagena]
MRYCGSWIISWCQQNVQAGSDSTAITLTSVIYHLLKNPDSMKALLAELDNANLPSPVPWDIAHKLPYLDSCIKEALRMTPAIGIPLERVAPEEGIELCGKHFECGTVLGVNAWVAHRNEELVLHRFKHHLEENTDIDFISLEGGQESALEKTSRIWRCIRSSLNC